MFIAPDQNKFPDAAGIACNDRQVSRLQSESIECPER